MAPPQQQPYYYPYPPASQPFAAMRGTPDIAATAAVHGPAAGSCQPQQPYYFGAYAPGTLPTFPDLRPPQYMQPPPMMAMPTIQIVNTNTNTNTSNSSAGSQSSASSTPPPRPPTRPPHTDSTASLVEVLAQGLYTSEVAISKQPYTGDCAIDPIELPDDTLIYWHKDVPPKSNIAENGCKVWWIAVSLSPNGGAFANRRVTAVDKDGHAQQVHGWVPAHDVWTLCTPSGGLNGIAVHGSPDHGSRFDRLYCPYVLHGDKRNCGGFRVSLDHGIQFSCRCCYSAIYWAKAVRGKTYAPLDLPEVRWKPEAHGWVKAAYLK